MEIQRLKTFSTLRVMNLPMDFKRYLYDDMIWSDRLIGLSGARGTGKTTLMLQRLKSLGLAAEEALYVSLDDMFFTDNKLVYFAEDYYAHGGKYLFLDEIHKYGNWSQELKNIYDNLPELKVVFTSSSALDIHRGQYDLSRRALVYKLAGLSFREYINFVYGLHLAPLTLEEVLHISVDKISEISQPEKPLMLFSTYLKTGYYPFFAEYKESYFLRLTEVLNTVLESDLPGIFNIDVSSVVKLKKFIYLLSSMVPFTPNISKLAERLNVTRPGLLRYIELLDRANILNLLTENPFGINYLNKPEKIFLENTNLMYAYDENNVNKGTLRETFFLNQLAVKHSVSYPKDGDFMVDAKYLFEVGGKNKSGKQIVDHGNAYIASDEIEYRTGNKIPLWLFGFLY
ncbi:MAG: AAA family ATPase [Bacteroidetes bacterium CG18_big_fil_WC_8_21_14_2_50_41_14]|nr:MAG: AAA family ATPase [Bacteroidetes bacterium CG18_big_fil_WC_8_21_14_2_50_41_14]PJB55027.1 MAG: AAA family ATPase [Bacteroidetes bacterium CG_4_9_14_3_um_filter_41_19]